MHHSSCCYRLFCVLIIIHIHFTLIFLYGGLVLLLCHHHFQILLLLMFVRSFAVVVKDYSTSMHHHHPSIWLPLFFISPSLLLRRIIPFLPFLSVYMSASGPMYRVYWDYLFCFLSWDLWTLLRPLRPLRPLHSGPLSRVYWDLWTISSLFAPFKHWTPSHLLLRYCIWREVSNKRNMSKMPTLTL